MFYNARCLNGIFERIERVYVDRRLLYMPAAQAGIINHVDTFNGPRPGYTLMSYATPAATLSDTGILTVDCLCSASTRRHVSAFLKEFCPHISYYDAKAAYNGGYSIDVNTGDHIDNTTGEVLSA